MGAAEKQSLIDSISLKLLEELGISPKEIKPRLTEVLNNYEISFCQEMICEGMDTESLMQRFKEGKKAVGMTDKTLQQYEIAVATLEKVSGKTLKEATSDDITNFMRVYGATVSSVTLKAKYQLLSSVYNYLFQRRFLMRNPMLFVDVPKATVVYKQPMSSIDLEKLKHACEILPEGESVRDTAIIYTFLCTGCRVSELSKLKIEDVDFDNKVCKVMGKGRKERPVVLNDKAIYRLRLYLATRKDVSPSAPLFAHIRGEELPMTKDGMSNIIRKITRMASVNTVTCHSFRRFYATELRRRNVSVQMIANSLGHANLNQINRYSLYSSKEMLDTIRQTM